MAGDAKPQAARPQTAETRDAKPAGSERRWVALALGSNQGDREALLARAREAVAALYGPLERVSNIYETEPVGPPGQGPYLNQVVLLSAQARAEEMIASLQAIEAKLGRKRAAGEERWGPRPIDIDILLEEGTVRRTPDLVLPHPRLHERAFVLAPLAEVLPEWRHPLLGKTVLELLAATGRQGTALWTGRERSADGAKCREPR
ncbi:MAG: 2-amino-4-hydroxy-6-hydroxymethyldihydropteridine diphosphokinase [Candidatus Eisenbacteria bacterium]|nr:2-amino-4-hydroxy-6-hydroxymethyldihydropteridine diphosphokinase [Candidatus Eisenbacteria bacterium]